MSQGEIIRICLQDELPQLGMFLVDITVKPGNRITVYLDSMKGVTIEECTTVSRLIESKLNRETEDFELEVSSAGLENPLKLPQQYQKNLGRLIDVITFDGMKTTGTLIMATGEFVSLEVETIKRDEKTHKKVKVVNILEKQIKDIKTAKVNLSLKK